MIRRVTSYAFLLLFLFNSIGYYGLVEVVKMRLTSQTVQKFESDGQYLGADLIFAVPVDKLNRANTNENATVHGEIVYNEQVYELVKSKYHNGVLYIMCKKNPEATKVREDLIDYTRIFAGQDAGQTNSTIKLINLVCKYYVPFTLTNELVTAAWNRNIDHGIYSNLYQRNVSPSIFHPPQL